MNDRLKPCPFCGDGYPKIFTSTYDNNGFEDYTIECEVCTGSVGVHDTKEEAIKTWNTRVVKTCDSCKHHVPMTMLDHCTMIDAFSIPDPERFYCPLHSEK